MKRAKCGMLNLLVIGQRIKTCKWLGRVYVKPIYHTTMSLMTHSLPNLDKPIFASSEHLVINLNQHRQIETRNIV